MSYKGLMEVSDITGVSIDILVSAAEIAREAMAAAGVPTEDTAAAATEAARVMRRNMDIDMEIKLVRMNPSLSRLQKWRIIRQLKKMGAEPWSGSQ